MRGTHSVDARQLLGQLQHHGDEDGLAVEGRAEQLRDGDLLLPHHLPTLLLHLLQVSGHVCHSAQLLQHWRERRGGGGGSEQEEGQGGGWGGGQGPALTTLGSVLLIAVDEQEAGALGAEGQHDALHQGWDEDDAQQQGPQLLVAQDGVVQAEHLGKQGRRKRL